MGWTKRVRCLGRVLALGVAGLLSAGALGAAQAPSSPEQPSAPAPSEPSLVSYAEATDRELTELAARWDDLSAGQRRALLSEMKLRMARHGAADGRLRIAVTRRYGTVVRHSNGATATLRIELRSLKSAQPSFGAGFEQRVLQEGKPAEAPEADPPVVKVADQQ